MIKTRFTVPVNIDGTVFNITIREISSLEKKTLEDIGKEHKKILDEQKTKEKEIEKNKVNLEEAQHSLEVNREMLPLVPLSEKLGIFIDIKKDGINIAKLKKERLNLERADFTQANATLESIYKKKFDLAVEETGKTELIKAIDNSNISYQTIWEEIDNEIKEQTKKKSNASEDGQNK